MIGKRFLISSLALAGFIRSGSAEAALPNDGAEAKKPPLEPAIFKLFRQDHLFSLAGHRSHSSHSSHSSHRSGSGGGYLSAPVYSPPPPVYTPPARVYTPAPAASPPSSGTLPSAPATSTPRRLPPLSSRSELFNDIVRRVQLGLQAYGYYDGAIDGVVGNDMKASLRKFQEDYSLKATGTITPEVLDALKIVAR